MEPVVLPVRRVRLETFAAAGLLLVGLAFTFGPVTAPARVVGVLLALYGAVAVAWRLAGRDVVEVEGDQLVLRRAVGPVVRETVRAPVAGLRTREDTSSHLVLMRPSDLGLGVGALELHAGGRAHRFGEVDADRARELVRRLR